MSKPENDLLTSSGQPCPTRINARVDQVMEQYAGASADYREKQRRMTHSVWLAVAVEQAKRFGRAPDEVRLLDIQNSLQALDYDGYRTPDVVSAERHALHEERRAIQDRLRATSSALASDVMAAQLDEAA